MAWLNLIMPNQTVTNGLKAKKIKLPQMNFFLEKQLIKFPCTYWTIVFGTNHYYFPLHIGPFHCAEFKKILTADPELWGCAIFGPKMVHMPQTNFIWKIISIILIYLLAPFIVQNFKKILPVDQEMRMHNFWAENGSFPQMRFFSENLLIRFISFVHAYLHARNQSQILIY